LDAAAEGAYVRTDAEAEGYDLVCLRSADALQAAFAPQAGMTCCSLLHSGVELIGERYGLTAYARGGVTMGMSLMHPWADRLSSWTYTACGTTVRLPISPLLHTDHWGLPVNGVHPSSHAWVMQHSGAAGGSAWLDATLPFDRPRQLELFPFPHRLCLHAEVTGRSVCIYIEIEATDHVAVPVCFGYRVYVRRGHGTTVVLPERRRIVTDERLLPTGATEAMHMRASTVGVDELREVSFLGTDRRLTIASDTRRLTIELLSGFPLTHVRSVAREPHVMLEALTAPPDALRHNLFPVASPGQPYQAALRLSVDELSWDRSRLTP
jgi:galactose mutarotase-like enzyme